MKWTYIVISKDSGSTQSIREKDVEQWTKDLDSRDVIVPVELALSAPALLTRVQELEALVKKLADLGIRADHQENTHKINALVQASKKLLS